MVEVDVVGHRAGVGDVDVRGDEAPAEPAWDQVAVSHPGAPDDPARFVVEPVDHELLDDGWHLDGWIGTHHVDDGAVRRHDGSRFDQPGVIAQQAQVPRGAVE